MPIVHGGLASPFVKKVCAFLAEKGISPELRPRAPFPKTPELLAMNPLGKIPIYEDGDLMLPDSSAICAYVERVQPKPALYPSDPKAYARALFVEEFADTKLGEVLGGVFFQRVIRPNFFQQETDEAAIAKAKAETIPPALDWIESQLAAGVLGGSLSIAEIAVGAQLANFRLAGEKIDGARLAEARGLRGAHARAAVVREAARRWRVPQLAAARALRRLLSVASTLRFDRFTRSQRRDPVELAVPDNLEVGEEHRKGISVEARSTGDLASGRRPA